MLKIGAFALLSKISINMLHHYDEIGLLKQAQTNNISGYRYYNEKQLVVANHIQALKQMGLSLAIIRQILNESNEPGSLELS